MKFFFFRPTNQPIFRLKTALFLAILTLPLACCSQPTRAAQLPDEEDDEFRPGLVATYRAVGKSKTGESKSGKTEAGKTEAARIERRLSFDWADRSPDQRLSAGPFQAKFEGFLMSQAPGKYQLHAYVGGSVTVKLAGRTLLSAKTERPEWRTSEAIELPFDWHPIEIEFKSSGKAARLSLFWTGPGFGLEPIGPAQWHHDPAQTPATDFDRGSTLVRAFRCAACHDLPVGQAAAAPALDQLPGRLNRTWLSQWLRDSHVGGARPIDVAPLDAAVRRMPYFKMGSEDRDALAAYLLADSGRQAKDPPPPALKDKKGKKVEPDATRGERLFMTTGCLACHQMESFGAVDIWSGGDLTNVARKRPASFFLQWLTDPRRLNRDHRMPQFDLTPLQRADLAAYLATRDASEDKATDDSSGSGSTESGNSDSELVVKGRKLFGHHQCHACHTGPKDEQRKPIVRSSLSRAAVADSDLSCLKSSQATSRPYYPLDDDDRAALRRFLLAAQRQAPRHAEARELIRQRNCFACHARSETAGLASRLPAIGKKFPALAALIPAMTPPSLESVGDKLHDAALRDSILRRGPVHRPWLLARMPAFNLSEQQVELLTGYFVTADRIPHRDQHRVPKVSEAAIQTLGGRLVTSGGFGCTSCHQVGSVLPPKAPLNAMGPDLSQMGKRIRYPWFDRWVRNPARIVPRMEMPSVKLAVHGLLDDDVDLQLATVWHALNQPGFQPPKANPVRVVRQSGQDLDGRAEIITDVVRMAGGQVYIKPLLLGLPNRLNVLYDLENARLAEWSVGDTARQRTEGKTWFWEMAGAPVAHLPFADTEWRLIDATRELVPRRDGQFVTEFDAYRHRPGGVQFRHRLHFGGERAESDGKTRGSAGAEHATRLDVEQAFGVLERQPSDEAAGAGVGFYRQVAIRSSRDDVSVRLRLLPTELMTKAALADDRRTLSLPGVAGVRITIAQPDSAKIDAEGFVTLPLTAGDKATLAIHYRSTLPVDQFPAVDVAAQDIEPQALDVVPGWEAIRLPLTDQVMPTALAWRGDGSLIFTSLKGRLWLVRDTNDDGLEDRITCFSDELAAPFGIAAGKDYVDVINKYALLRLYDDDGDNRSDRVRTLASGWSHTTDYHDWAVGLPRDSRGGYFMATACQQDKRSPAAARWRGRVMHLVPRRPSPANPRAFDVRVISKGHRFPIGIARSAAGDLFVTDNQGNYNPFNELNHVVRGAHYGFLNAVERKPGYQPPVTAPAIKIPHPWTRSVNGICFLDTPPELREARGGDVFGPWEGHLIGCEYDTRRLIRMSFQRVGDTLQGAAYPFSYDEPPGGEPLRGPLVCAVSPGGELYVGCIRDSGWGGSNNVGGIVRLRLKSSDKIPTGLAEVQATATGFRLLFTHPVDGRLANDKDNFTVSSYTRVPTPAYGGPDKNRRKETVRAIRVSDDRREVQLDLRDLREGYVYEIRLKALVPKGKEFFPAEAYYTLNRIP